ncbi:unnamed protein product [Caenorhabditis angaria]|uniref:BTB domain-containing protein n=1 Tax=Caenorhabditis angaria TaxID=860376 RepID=A0A9P1MX62_9PELO|nr:unnamed protein product [Caenorhabditis angaria]
MMNPLIKNGNKIRWKCDEITYIDKKGLLSDVHKIDQFEWKIKITKDESKYYGGVGIFMSLDFENSANKTWICEIDAEIVLVKQEDRIQGKSISKKFNFCFDQKHPLWGFPRFTDLDTFMEGGFIENDDEFIVIEVFFDFKYVEFGKHIPGFTDLIVSVEDADFYINKGFLCAKSKYFFDMLVNKKVEANIKIDISPREFRLILASFYSCFTICDDNFYMAFDADETGPKINLVDLANRFGVPDLHYKCEQYLITQKEDSMSLIQKIELAEQNDYENLMKRLVLCLKTAKDVKKIKESEEFNGFKDTTKIRILARLLDFY